MSTAPLQQAMLRRGRRLREKLKALAGAGGGGGVAFASLALCALVASGCGTDAIGTADPAQAGPPRHGGEVVLGMDQEPACLNTSLVCGGMVAASLMTSPLWDAFIGLDDDGKRFPLMAETIPTTDNGLVKTVGSKMTVTVDIRKQARWSDGKPVTCDDMVFTWKTMMDERWQVTSRVGWDKVEAIDCPTPKRFVVTFSEPYAWYLSIVGTAPFPKHDLEGKNFNSYLNAGAPVSSGPFRFKAWHRNVEYILERNENYWNKGNNDVPYLDRLVYRFIKDTNTMKVQLRTGEVDWINPPPDTSLIEELEQYPRSSFASEPGSSWENFAFNTEKFPTDDPLVRRAMAHAIDREQMTAVVLRGQTEPLMSSIMPTVKPYYTPAWSKVAYDEKQVEALLKKAGWTRTDKYWTKGGKELEVVFKSTAGNVLREKVAQLMQQNFKKNGIKMEIVMELPQVFFGQSGPQGSFHVAEWAWGGGVDPQQTTLFACDQVPSKKNDFMGNNNYRYCNKEVTKLLYQIDGTPDLKERAMLSRRVQNLMAADMPLLPLYLRPETVAYSRRLQNVTVNPYSTSQQLWNVQEWWVRSS